MANSSRLSSDGLIALGLSAEEPRPFSERAGTIADAGDAKPASAPPLHLLLCAGAVWSLAIIFTNILPTILELLRERLALDEGEMGSIGSAYVLGHGLVVASGPFWVRRVSVTVVTGAAFATAAAALALLAFISDVGILMIGWSLIGLATGAAAIPAFAILGDAADPTRSYSFTIFGSTLVATMISFALPHFGTRDAFLAGALLFALSIPWTLGLRGYRIGTADTVQSARGARTASRHPLILAMLAGSIFLGMCWGGVYNFIGVIAAANGVEVRGAGWLVAVGLIGALAGSIAPAILGTRFGSPIRMIGMAMGGILLTCLAMTAAIPALFIPALAIQGALATAVYAYLLGLVRQLDTTNRFYIAFPAAQALSMAALTKLTGLFLSHWTPQAFMSVTALSIALSWIMLTVAHRQSPNATSLKESWR